MGRRRDSFELRTCASDVHGSDELASQPADVLAHIGARPGQWLTVVIMEGGWDMERMRVAVRVRAEPVERP